MADQDPKDFTLSPELHAYVVAHGTPPDEHQLALIAATQALGAISMMQIAPEQGALMTLLARLVGARTIVEVGTFTGYSTLCLARGLTDGGTVIACDVSDEWTSVGRTAWEAAGVADRIDLRLAPAVETLRALPADLEVDLAFVDADKTGYQAYADELIPRLRTNGLLLVDNVLWGGGVIDAGRTDDDTEAIRAFNDRLAADDRVEVVLLPIADGLTVARKV
jgi:caffeoyl-CoA O-methyltransferase